MYESTVWILSSLLDEERAKKDWINGLQCLKPLHVVVKKGKDPKLRLIAKSVLVGVALQVRFLLLACISGSFPFFCVVKVSNYFSGF